MTHCRNGKCQREFDKYCIHECCFFTPEGYTLYWEPDGKEQVPIRDIAVKKWGDGDKGTGGRQKVRWEDYGGKKPTPRPIKWPGMSVIPPQPGEKVSQSSRSLEFGSLNATAGPAFGPQTSFAQQQAAYEYNTGLSKRAKEVQREEHSSGRRRR